MFQKVVFSHYVLRATLSVVWRHNDITGKIPYKAMTNENKIIYLDRETMQGNVKKNLRALGIVYVLNMIFNVYHFGFCSIAISIFDISIEDRKITHPVIFHSCSLDNI